jgi:hypothetical protein
MKSHEVLKQAIAAGNIKELAGKMGLSTSLMYKWCQEPPVVEDPEQSGAKNPLDRVVELYRLTGDAYVVSWVCEQAGGYFVENPKRPDVRDVGSAVLQNTQAMIKEFSDLLSEVSRAVEDGSGIDAKEALRIRKEWEQLKRKAEGFVVGCEDGTFR